MRFRTESLALASAIALFSLPATTLAFDDCPADHVYDGYTCDMRTGEGKNGGFFRVTFPSDWDGDLVIYNHGFDLNPFNIGPHEHCAKDHSVACESNAPCTLSGDYCINIGYAGQDEILLPMGKAIAAGTYHQTGWAVFGSAKDIKDIIDYVKKDSGYGDQLKRVIVTGHSLGGAVTADATLKLKLDGAVPQCGAVGGGLPTWDAATEVRLVYDFLCDDVPGAAFIPPASGGPDYGTKNVDQTSMAIKVDTCFGILGIVPDDGFQDERLTKFLELTQFSGYAPPDGSGLNVATIMGFATLGLGDFVYDDDRLKSKRIGWNSDPDLDYASIGTNPTLAAEYDAGVKRLTKGPGRSKLKKASYPDFTKGKGKKVEYPILSMAGNADWLVIPEFQTIYDTALSLGGKLITQTWIDTYGHCVFSAQETEALWLEYFDWLGPVDGPLGTQPTPADVEARCLSLPGGIDGDTCNFNSAYEAPALYERLPEREDWPPAAKTPVP